MKCKLFGSRLAAVLARRSIMKKDFAKMCGVSSVAVSQWLSGQVPRPPIMLLIAKHFGNETVAYLLGDFDRMPEPTEEAA